MKEKNTADKLAEKAFYSKKIQDSWQGHMAAFGPILEPAFKEDYQSRVHLTAALNLISNRKIKEGLEKLRMLEEKCVCDADWAVWYFCHAVAAELSSKPDQIVAYYEKAAQYHHKFHLPYIKLARYAHFAADFEKAETWYWKGISCLENQSLSEREADALSSAYANLCSCLTMMHRYEDALTALDRSKDVAERVPSRLASEAILYAAMGEPEKVNAVIQVMEKQGPGLLEPTLDMTGKILSGEHAHFCAQPVEEGKLHAFWAWFSTAEITEQAVAEQLAEVFPFMQRSLQVRIGEGTIFFRDYYVKALTAGYASLIDACPEEIRNTLRFEIVH